MNTMKNKKTMQPPTFMIVPSLACQASCKYCFGPYVGAVMEEQTARETVKFVQSIATETTAKEISIIFHGGEPLLAPIAVWRVLLDEIKTRLADYKVKLNLQSNLWNLDDEYLQLLIEHNVALGTSLDGPQELCDTNRGEGYFERTDAAIQRAHAAGCSVSAIATVTKQTLPHTQEIAKYFRNRGMSLVLHGALAGMDKQDSPFALTAEDYANMVRGLFPWYIQNRKHMQMDTLDHFAKGIVTGNPGVCTLRDCFGMFLSISPTGDITSCQRFSGKPDFCLGNIFDHPTLAQLYDSPAAKRQLARQSKVSGRCGDCDFHPICKGGCYYNAIASGDGVIDTLCEGYKSIYTFVQDNIMQEMQSLENIEAVAAGFAEPGEHPLLRKGAYISLSGKIHPARIADNARRVLSIYELSKTNEPHIAAQNLYNQKICGNAPVTEKLLKDIQQGLEAAHKTRNNCYAHVTFNCNLRCKHCYAEAGNSADEMKIADFERLVVEAIAGKFRQLVITGGEPLVHTKRDALQRICKENKGHGTNLVLRTNLTGDFSEADFVALAEAFDQVVVSVDGSEDTHDTRRGVGSYHSMVRNLEEYALIAAGIPGAAELSLACVMGSDEVNGEPGQSVQQLGERLGVKRVRFRPLLPIGRAAQLDEPVMCEGLMQHVSPEDMLKSECRPLTTCGIGQNLYVKPNGRSYPCYAWCKEHTFIGNVFDNALDEVLQSRGFTRLIDCSVDTIAKCKNCEYRYLCGGACRAWGNQNELDLNAAPPECAHLQTRAQKLVDAAREYIKF
jgi:uncharacterized protein